MQLNLKNSVISFHLQIYTAKELREMLAKNGFEKIAQYSYGRKEDVKVCLLD